MSTTNIGTAPEKYWGAEHGAPANGKDYAQTAESNWDDTASAYREVQGRSADSEQVKQASDSRAYLRHHYGSTKSGLERADQWQDAAVVDPIGTIEAWRRDKARRLSTPMPEKPKDEEPPDYLDEKGRREWELQQDVKRGVRDAAAERADEEDAEDALPTIARLKEKYGRPAGDLIERIAGVEMAGDISNGKVADKLFAMASGGLTPEQYVQSQHATAQADQWTNGLMARVEQAKQNGAYAGVERPRALHMADFFDHLARTGQHVDYNTAWDAATQYADAQEQARADDMVRRFPEVSGRYPELQTEAGRQAVAQIVRERGETNNWERDLHDAAETFQERRHAAAEKARHASGSISGSSGSGVNETDDPGETPEDSARRAWRSVTNSTHV